MALFSFFPARDLCKTKFGNVPVNFICAEQKYVWSNGTYCPANDADLLALPNSGNFISNSFFHASKSSALDLSSAKFREYSYDIASKREIVNTYRDFAEKREVNVGSKPETDSDYSNAFSTDKLILDGDHHAQKEFAAKSYIELTAFYTSGTIAGTVPHEYRELYKYTSGTIVHVVRLLQSRDIYDASGRMAGYGVGFFIREEILEPLLGPPLPSNVNASTFLGAVKAAHIYNSIDSFVMGANLNLLNLVGQEQVFVGSLLKHSVDPFMFNVLYDYSGIADEDAMTANAVLSVFGIALQVVAAVSLKNSPFTMSEHAYILVKKNAIALTVNMAAVLTAEFIIKPTATMLGEYVLKPAGEYGYKAMESIWSATSDTYDFLYNFMLGASGCEDEGCKL